jgi:hypothetical protein
VEKPPQYPIFGQGVLNNGVVFGHIDVLQSERRSVVKAGQQLILTLFRHFSRGVWSRQVY